MLNFLMIIIIKKHPFICFLIILIIFQFIIFHFQISFHLSFLIDSFYYFQLFILIVIKSFNVKG